jgi:hypothetical protein
MLHTFRDWCYHLVKLTSGLLATITLEVISFCAYALFAVLLQFFKCILEVVFCDCASVISLVSKRWPLIGETEK